ncbi:hypothetical protein BDY21DRAFT_366119 [Lineolata rhizophorae]|uniref:Uncharacterized protein n=1 Tax=Lineolata rhizophorae TaxID=578093 RepID=A0A6A6NSK2_9PEZI|nr:hypothetical protein BDY21DRAFT_366119 [Lineolata rhizophorae]
MEKIQSMPIPTLLEARKAARVAVFVRKSSPLYTISSNEVVKAACSTLKISIDDSHPTLLFIDKCERLDILVFDVFHVGYVPSTAHHEASLPVVLVDCGKRYSVIKAASEEFRKEVNVSIARQHNLNGWDGKPPYTADHTGPKPPTYPNPRDPSMLWPTS